MKRLAIVLALFAAPAFAQPAAIDLQKQRNDFMGAFAQCDTASIGLQQQLAEANAKIKALEAAAKGEPAAK